MNQNNEMRDAESVKIPSAIEGLKLEASGARPVPKDGTRLIHDILAELGWYADASEVAERVRRLEVGLSCEDEFAVLCGWLGKCELLHKLEQTQIPLASTKTYQVPDFLAKFNTQSTDKPVLIEVKSKKKSKLSHTPEYLAKLTSYAALLDLPLLMAWKFHGVWVLLETKHLVKAEKNFNITFSDAMKQNLLGPLVGDVAYKIGPLAGICFKSRRDRLLETVGTTKTWQAVIESVSFTDRDGVSRAGLPGEVAALFTTWDLQLREELTASHITQQFTAGEQGMLFAHMALVRLLNWESGTEERPRWRNLLQEEAVVESIQDFETALELGLQEKIVSHIFHVMPQDLPEFLS